VSLRLAQIHWIRGDARAARERAAEALERQEAAGDTPGGGARRAAILRLLGRSAISLGDFQEATGYLEEAIELDPNPAHAANAHGYLATAYAHLNREEEAAAAAERAMEIAAALESPALLAVARAQGAVAYGNTGRWERAATLAQQGLTACRRQELPVYAFVAQAILGRCRHHQGESDAAVRLLHEALAWAEGHDYLLFRYLAPLYLAEIALDRGDHDAARGHARETLELAEQTGNRWAAARARAYLERGTQRP
jgi:tetratricopeptide (TPR) repeat protein